MRGCSRNKPWRTINKPSNTVTDVYRSWNWSNCDQEGITTIYRVSDRENLADWESRMLSESIIAISHSYLDLLLKYFLKSSAFIKILNSNNSISITRMTLIGQFGYFKPQKAHKQQFTTGKTVITRFTKCLLTSTDWEIII